MGSNLGKLSGLMYSGHFAGNKNQKIQKTGAGYELPGISGFLSVSGYMQYLIHWKILVKYDHTRAKDC